MGQGWISKVLEETFRPERYRWYHALAFGSTVNLASGLSGRPLEVWFPRSQLLGDS